MAEHSLTLKVDGDVYYLEEVADHLWSSADYKPDVKIEGKEIHLSGHYDNFAEVLAPFLHAVEDTDPWLVHNEDCPDEFWRVKDHQLEFCDVGPDGNWHPVFRVEAL